MLKRWLMVSSLTVALPLLGESPYVYLFSSGKARAVAGLSRQKARRLLAEQNFQRASRLLQSAAISREEYDWAKTAATVAVYDEQIAELKAKYAAISLDLAVALARNGQRIHKQKLNPPRLRRPPQIRHSPER